MTIARAKATSSTDVGCRQHVPAFLQEPGAKIGTRVCVCPDIPIAPQATLLPCIAEEPRFGTRINVEKLLRIRQIGKASGRPEVEARIAQAVKRQVQAKVARRAKVRLGDPHVERAGAFRALNGYCERGVQNRGYDKAAKFLTRGGSRTAVTTRLRRCRIVEKAGTFVLARSERCSSDDGEETN